MQDNSSDHSDEDTNYMVSVVDVTPKQPRLSNSNYSGFDESSMMFGVNINQFDENDSQEDGLLMIKKTQQDISSKFDDQLQQLTKRKQQIDSRA